MTRTTPYRRHKNRMWGVFAMVFLGALLGGCSSGEDTSAAADQQFQSLEHVVSASTTMARPGSPLNRQFLTSVVVEPGLADEQIATVVEGVLEIARDVLGPEMNYTYSLSIGDRERRLDLENIVELVPGLDVSEVEGLEGAHIRVSPALLESFQQSGGDES